MYDFIEFVNYYVIITSIIIIALLAKTVPLHYFIEKDLNKNSQ